MQRRPEPTALDGLDPAHREALARDDDGVEDDDGGYDRITREMTIQAGIVSGNAE
jgi:hypothetical protein